MIFVKRFILSSLLHLCVGGERPGSGSPICVHDPKSGLRWDVHDATGLGCFGRVSLCLYGQVTRLGLVCRPGWPHLPGVAQLPQCSQSGWPSLPWIDWHGLAGPAQPDLSGVEWLARPRPAR